MTKQETETVEIVTAEEVKDHLGMDFVDVATERQIEIAIRSADLYIQGAVGDSYPRDDARAKQLALMLIADLFDERGTSAKQGSTSRKLKDSIIFQLRLEQLGKSGG